MKGHKKLNRQAIITLILLPLLFWGCASGTGTTYPKGELPPPEMVAPPNRDKGYKDSRTLASHNLTAKGYDKLQRGDIDGALRLLERAVGINPSDGPGYYFLAEAWIAKGRLSQATRFNKLARIYLRNEPTWSLRAKTQKDRIDEKIAMQESGA